VSLLPPDPTALDSRAGICLAEAEVSEALVKVGTSGYDLEWICYFGNYLYMAQEFIRIGSFLNLRQIFNELLGAIKNGACRFRDKIDGVYALPGKSKKSKFLIVREN